MTVPSRALGDHLAENICLLGLLAATCGKIGREIYTLMKTEFGEVEEPVPPGTVGSSTMPQKRNPKLCQDIIAAAAEVRALVPLALEAMQTEHEADRTTSLMMDAAEARACIATGDMLSRLGEVMRGLRLDPARMRANLDLGGGLIMAEAVMLELGAAIGRQHAHDVVYDAAQSAFTEGRSFAALLAADPRVTAHLDARRDRGVARPDRLYRAVRRHGARRGGAGARVWRGRSAQRQGGSARRHPPCHVPQTAECAALFPPCNRDSAHQHGLADHLAIDHRLHRLRRLRPAGNRCEMRGLSLPCAASSISACMLAIASSGSASFNPPMRTPIASMPLISR